MRIVSLADLGPLNFWLGAVVIFGVWPIVAAIWKDVPRYRANRRWRAGQCTACAHDLGGSTSGYCPACGTRIRKPE